MQLWTLVIPCLMAMQMVQVTESEKILALAPISSKSHKNFYMGILGELAGKGHQITLVTPYKASKEKKNVREVIVHDVDITKVIPNLFKGNSASGPMALMGEAPNLCSKALGQKDVQDLLGEEFDFLMVSIFLAECFLSFVHILKVPYAWLIPAGLMGPYGAFTGNPVFPSVAGNVLTGGTHPLSFSDRLISTVLDVISFAAYDRIVMTRMDAVCRERGLCPKDMPFITDLRANASLALINSVKSIESPVRPYVPSVIHCGGIHCHPADPLPEDLEEWVQGAGDAGFIFFSLGSAVTPSSMPEEYRKILIEVFGSLKQRVLWKWDLDTMDDLPSNVRLGKWLPQQDILGDSRLRLFITHGGLLSTFESMYHGIPVLGIPLCNDQHMNMLEVQVQGWGLSLLWNELTPGSLRNAINEVMTNERMREEAKRRSSVMKDQPMHPADVATYWVEYVMRHNGAPHLRSPLLDLPWYKLYNVDVWLSVAVVLVLIAVVTFKLLRALCSCLCSAKSKTKME